MIKLKSIKLNGFKSIRQLDMEFGDMNVLIGVNGAGKSNLISFFKMLNEMMSNRLQFFIRESGSAQSLLHYGAKETPMMEATLTFEKDSDVSAYYLALKHIAGDSLAFFDETLEAKLFQSENSVPVSLGSGHLETNIKNSGEETYVRARTIGHLLNNCRPYHFHDTSSLARVKQHCYVADNSKLLSDAGNLAAVLYRFKIEKPDIYRTIVSTVQRISPFFDDFELEPTGLSNNETILNWRARDSDVLFGPHQISDGTLRAMCLVTLLSLPKNELPELLIVDEPELGLHPYALNTIAALFNIASFHTQVLVSTQSSAFLNNFDPENVIVVDRVGKESRFAKPNIAETREWLENYTLGEVWEKNIFGGTPEC